MDNSKGEEGSSNTPKHRLPEHMVDISYDSYNLSEAIETTSYEVNKSTIAIFQKVKGEVLEGEFEQMKGITDYSVDHSNSLYEGGRKLDRYSDILPYDHNRVKLKEGQYINASFIHIPVENSFIATQGPKEETVSDFWQMIYEQEVVLIVMVCNLIEKKYPKCHKYWCSEEKIQNFTLLPISENKIDFNLVEREFKLTNTKTNEIRLVKQIHFVGWPDHGVPESNDVYKSFFYMLDKVDEAKSKSKGPIVVHCSAGVGRTGTFMAIYNLHYSIRNQLKNNQASVKFNIWNTVRKLKELRRSSVENVLQYKFIYSFLAKYLVDVLK